MNRAVSDATDFEGWVRGRGGRLQEISRTSETLGEYLRRLVVDDLVRLERWGMRERLPTILSELWDPRRTRAFWLISWAATDLSEFNQGLQRAWADGEVYAWVLPPAAALAFYGVYQSCVLFWLQDGPPPDPAKVSPAVARFVEAQVRIFTRSIGARH